MNFVGIITVVYLLLIVERYRLYRSNKRSLFEWKEIWEYWLMPVWLPILIVIAIICSILYGVVCVITGTKMILRY